MELTKLNKKNCKEAAELLIDCFLWNSSQEGHDYWSNVYFKLLYMSKQ